MAISKLQQPNKEMESCLTHAQLAARQYAQMDQASIDAIVQNMTLAGIQRHMELAKLELEETRRGIFEDKIILNMHATESVFHAIKYVKTAGEIENNHYEGYKLIAEPIGPVVSIVTDTSPVATILFQSLIAVKTRNPILFIFHKESTRCSIEAVQTMHDAAILAGAPEYCLQWLDHLTYSEMTSLISNPAVAAVLTSGDEAAAKAAKQFAKATLSVAYGNTPCYIDQSADLKQAITDIILSKNFDNGMMFTSEQGLIIHQELYDQALRMLSVLGCYVLDAAQCAQLSKQLFTETGALRHSYIGKSAYELASAAELSIPADTKLLIAPLSSIGVHEPLSFIKPCPILSLYRAEHVERALELADQLLELGQAKHSVVIHCQDAEVSSRFSDRLIVNRIIVNAPAIEGSLSFKDKEQLPFQDMGYQSSGHQQHTNMELLRLKKISNRSVDMQWFKIPPKLYFAAGATQYLSKMPDISRVMIVTDHNMEQLGYVDKVQYYLRKRAEPVQVEVFSEVAQEPTIDLVMSGTNRMHAFQPDCIVALGGGSAIDAAKAMWLFYESPDTDFHTIKMKFMNIRNRVYKYPHLGKRAKLVAIPTTSGTGSEVTSFATITDTTKGQSKYPLADYELTPDVAIIDSEYTASLTPAVIADTGMDVLTHAIESYVSIMANDFSDGLAIKAIQLVLENLEKSFATGDPTAREKMHHASTIAGMAFSNAFLGVCHSLSHKFSAEFGMPHGRANAILLPHVIRYNASRPTKFQNFPNYKHFQADVRYAEIARLAGLPANSTSEGVTSLISSIRQINRTLGLAESFQEAGIPSASFESKVNYLAERAFEDQYTNYNPRLPLVSELAELYRQAYYGNFL
ncbi:bifunctional acetaldehyde-CoA/alcohol dehydrogenase [Paenibacillus septentrionalis]|uniref:Aldehyde-alcohol dehydrogenase n=1 Tax=Paenibacillus septentrionalis TaxID=429342 RepID=A0ABW1V7R0_9BACL